MNQNSFFMKKLSLYGVILTLAVFISCESSMVDQDSNLNDNVLQENTVTANSSDASVEGQYLILFKGNKIPKGFEKDVVSAGGNIIYQHESGFAFVGGFSEEAASAFQARKDISEFAADISFSMNTPENPSSESATPSSPSDPTTAFFYPLQWNMSAIGADQAWAAGYLGDEDVTVAILDGGIDYTHPDLAGLVDLTRSASFVTYDDALVDFYYPTRHPITDLGYHGTHVAATVASNAYLAAGVTSKTTLLGVKVCSINEDIACSFGAIFSGLFFATENGADIINMSLGGAFIKAGSKGAPGFVNSAMNAIRRSGATVVVAAGNEGYNLDKDGVFYDAFCDSPNAICVSATGPSTAGDVDAFAPYSNYGRSAIDVAAPGGTSAGFIYAACTTTSLILPAFGIDCSAGNSVLGLTGTSMATPHVSGLAALLVSQGIDKPSQIKAKILQSADDLGQNGTDPYYGKGRINVPNALGL